jgi:CheY-like chemotaxis protein
MAKLLLLDDDEAAIGWMTAALESRGHVVRGFTSARSALESLDTLKPDLIVADVLMPEIDGLAFARIARRHHRVPILFVSIAAKEAEAVILGAAGYVRKPASANEVREAVERVLGAGARRNTVLIVDDDPDVCELYTHVLDPHFDVLSAANGVPALELLRTRRIDLAIIDVHMPVMNGAELVRAIRSDPLLERLPILVQTSDRTALDAHVWRTLHVTTVLDKSKFLDWFDAQLRVTE